MNEDQICPHCKTSKYRNPSLKLYVNLCGHALCENCLDLLFLKGTGNCTQCGVALRRNNFRLRLFEDDRVEKELDVRRRILRDFNKTEEDFETEREYDDYLEQIEEIIFNLTNEVRVEETKQMIEEYRKANEENISKNRGKLNRDQQLIESILEQEKEQDDWRRKMHVQEDEQTQYSKMKKLQKEQLVDELMYSDLPAEQILMTHTTEKRNLEERHRAAVEKTQQAQAEAKAIMRGKQPTYFSTGIQLGRASSVFKPVPKDESKPYEYVHTELPLYGPHCPELEEVESEGYLFHVRSIEPSERAGGYLAAYPCVRALQEAFCGLYFKSA